MLRDLCLVVAPLYLDSFPRFPVPDRVSIFRREKPDHREAAWAAV
jgi:hypothetical protein